MVDQKQPIDGAQNLAPQNPEQASEEDQDLYNIFVAQGVKMAYDVGDKLEGKGSVKLLGDALYQIVNKIETAGEKQGINFPVEVVLAGSGEILPHLIKVSRAQPSEKQQKGIIGIAVGRWIENAHKTGKMTPDELKQMGQDAHSMAQQMEASEKGPMSSVGIGGMTETEKYVTGR